MAPEGKLLSLNSWARHLTAEELMPRVEKGQSGLEQK